MTSIILVTGGTGTLGRHVVSRLREAGRDVRVLSRRGHSGQDGIQFVTGDLATGAGLESAVRGAGTIVHCAGNRKGDDDATQNLVAAASSAGAPHLVYISVVGVQRVSFAYFRAKLAAERVVAGSGLPWTTLRATQFYDPILKGAGQLARLPVIPVPAGFLVQPVNAGEVAARLAGLALGEPAGLVPDMAGPQVSSFAGLIRDYLRAAGRRRRVVPVWMPGIRPIRAGALLPAQRGTEEGTPEHTAGHRTWEDFLAERLKASGAP